MTVIKRDGREVEFDKSRIYNAILKAFEEVDGEITPLAQSISDDISTKIEKTDKKQLSVEKIQDIVEKKLMNSKRKDVAKAYILYRDKRSKIRNWNTEMMQLAGEKLSAKSIDNQNANVDEMSFGGRKGEADSVIFKQYALDNCMSEKSKYNHLNNRIYIHDLDSYAVGQHNCFDSATEFITKRGVVKFGDLHEGQAVTVLDMNGNWQDAIVRKYGKQKMYELTFSSGLTKKTVVCTRNHRWVLLDGTITDNIQIGDELYKLPKSNINYKEDEWLWCFGFVLGDGCDFVMRSKDKTRITNSAMKIRLCGNKVQYLDKFLKCGWSIQERFDNGDITLSTRGNGAFKQNYLDNMMWHIASFDDLCNIFYGYLAADGHIRDNGSIMISTSDIRVKKFIEDVSSVVGYHLWSFNEKHNDTEYKKDRTLYEFYLTKQQIKTPWKLIDIKVSRSGSNGCKQTWCVEEPNTHTFTLQGGMVTGNCLSIPFDDLLANGFNTRQTDVRPANSVSTAFQLLAVIFQLQSLQQFGGVSATHLDWTMTPYVRKSFYKHYKNGVKYLEERDLDYSFNNNLSIDDNDYKIYSPKTYQYAMDMTVKEIGQAVEAMYHNLNTLQSRSGNQLPFTSINTGTCTLPEGRLITKAILEGCIKGVGKLHRTSVFPCVIFQCMKGVNRKEGDPNYDLFRLALKSTSLRLYPNYCNCNWGGNEGYDKDNPKTYFSTMGCVQGEEIITYLFNDILYVESFKRMWNRIADYCPAKQQIPNNNDNLFIEPENLQIYDTEDGFVKVKKIIRNLSNEWLNVKISNGRCLTCTKDHPFHTTNRGRVRADELVNEDNIIINPSQYYKEDLVFNDNKAWLLGFILCDGCYDGHVTSSIALDTEDDIQEAYISRMKECFDTDVKVVEQHRGKKGNYKDLTAVENASYIIDYLSTKYEGLTKARRHIPNEVFSWNYTAKLNFLAGMIDADGYINNDYHSGSIVQLGSTNKELALQQMALAQSLGMSCSVYQNHYSKKNPLAVRYRVEFIPTEELVNYIVSQKKKDHYEETVAHQHFNGNIREVSEIKDMIEYSYDVETESDHFEVSGIYSHNCRTANGWDINGFGQLKDGRGNICPVTIILPTIAMEVKNNETKWCIHDMNGDIIPHYLVDCFMKELDKAIHDSKDMLIERFNWICSQPPESAKFMYENGLMAGYNEEEGTISALKHGTLAIGQLGLAEALQILIGCDHTTDKGMELAKKIESLFKKRCAEFKEEYKLNFGVYYTPAENLCFTALKKFRNKYGVIPNVSDKEFFTNSMHIPVWKELTPFEKIDLESQLTGYSSAGCITYVELQESVKHNLDGLEEIVNYAMDKDIPYFAINIPNDTCLECGYTDEINDKCPKCGSSKIQRLRRVTGYLTNDYKTAFNLGKQDEVEHRIKHDEVSVFNEDK